MKPIEKAILKKKWISSYLDIKIDFMDFMMKDYLAKEFIIKIFYILNFWIDILFYTFTNGNKIHTNYTLKHWMEKMKGYTFCQSYKSFMLIWIM